MSERGGRGQAPPLRRDESFEPESGPSIRRAGESDAAGILECLRSSFEPYRESYTPEGFADTILSPETIGRRLSELFVFVAVGGAGGGFAVIRDRARRCPGGSC